MANNYQEEFEQFVADCHLEKMSTDRAKQCFEFYELGKNVTENREKYLVIPESDIMKIEESRLFLHNKFCEKIPEELIIELIYNVTNQLYNITHKKYKEIYLNK